jgi:hypothetical protein
MRSCCIHVLSNATPNTPSLPWCSFMLLIVTCICCFCASLLHTAALSCRYWT